MIKSIIGIAFDCPDANELAEFYVKLTGWKKEISSDGWAGLRTPDTHFVCLHMRNNGHIRCCGVCKYERRQPWTL